MQTAELDLLDVDPFDLIEDEEPFVAAKEKVDAAASVAELLERALKVIAEFEESSRRPARKPRPGRKARVTAHLPGQHNQESHGNSVSSPNAIKGIEVLSIDKYADLYGGVQDDARVELGVNGEEMTLTARFFENGDMHVAVDLEDEKTQVLEEMDPESMRQLAYDLEDILAVDETDFEGGDSWDIVADAESTEHGFYVAKDGVGDVRIRPPDAADDDYLEVSSEKAADFVNALLDMADAYEEHFADGGEVVAGRARPPRRKPVVAHGNHDQSTHGRKRGLSVPKAGVPAPAQKKATPKAKPAAEVKPPAKKAAPKKAPAPRKKAEPKAKPEPRVAATTPVTAHLMGHHNQEDHAGGPAAGGVRSESRRRRRREFVKANDPLGAMARHLADLTADDFVGSGRVGDDGEVGVDLVGTMDSDGFRSMRVGVGARADNALEADEVAVLSDAQMSKLHDTLMSASKAAATGRAFDEVVDGEDNGDVRVTVDEGGRDVRVSAHSWTAQESASEGWDPVLEKEHILGRWPTRDDFASGADFDRYLDYGGFDSEGDYLDFTRTSPYEPDASGEMAPSPGSAAVLTPAQVGELTSVIGRLQQGRPWREERSGDPAPVTAHRKGKHNQQDHAGVHGPHLSSNSDGPLEGFASLSEDDYAVKFGESLDETIFVPGRTLRLFSDGTAHIAHDLDDGYQPLSGQLDKAALVGLRAALNDSPRSRSGREIKPSYDMTRATRLAGDLSVWPKPDGGVQLTRTSDSALIADLNAADRALLGEAVHDMIGRSPSDLPGGPLGDTEPGDERLLAKYDPHQLRNNQGEWTSVGVGGALDVLKLADRIDLKPGEKLVASQVVPSAAADWKMPSAVIDGPQGRELRLGFVGNEDTGRWSGADKGGTVKLGKPEMAALASKLREVHALGEQRRKDLDAANDDNDDTFAIGVLPGGEWGDIHYIAEGQADGDGNWFVDLRRRPPDAPAGWEPDYGYEGDTPVSFGPKHSLTFAKLLDRFATLPEGQEISAAAGADVTPGNDELHHWWTRGKGRALWVKSPEPWTTLVEQLMEHVEGLTLGRAKRWASRWYIEVFGYAANSDKARVAHGKPPRGKVIGPG